jgi:hypothetical protein
MNLEILAIFSVLFVSHEAADHLFFKGLGKEHDAANIAAQPGFKHLPAALSNRRSVGNRYLAVHRLSPRFLFLFIAGELEGLNLLPLAAVVLSTHGQVVEDGQGVEADAGEAEEAGLAAGVSHQGFVGGGGHDLEVLHHVNGLVTDDGVVGAFQDGGVRAEGPADGIAGVGFLGGEGEESALEGKPSAYLRAMTVLTMSRAETSKLMMAAGFLARGVATRILEKPML